MMEDPAASNWHVDKRIPAALIITLFLAFIGQTFILGAWISRLESRVSSVEDLIVPFRELSNRMVRQETILERVERKLDKLAP